MIFNINLGTNTPPKNNIIHKGLHLLVLLLALVPYNTYAGTTEDFKLITYNSSAIPTTLLEKEDHKIIYLKSINPDINGGEIYILDNGTPVRVCKEELCSPVLIHGDLGAVGGNGQYFFEVQIFNDWASMEYIEGKETVWNKNIFSYYDIINIYTFEFFLMIFISIFIFFRKIRGS